MLVHPDKQYPRQVEGKLEAMDFDLVLSSSLPFQYFYDYVVTNASFYKPYFEVYILGKMYQELLDSILDESCQDERKSDS